MKPLASVASFGLVPVPPMLPGWSEHRHSILRSRSGCDRLLSPWHGRSTGDPNRACRVGSPAAPSSG